jgi:hypothetical protein
MVQHPWADGVAAQVGADQLRSTLGTLQQLVAVLEAAQDG